MGKQQMPTAEEYEEISRRRLIGFLCEKNQLLLHLAVVDGNIRTETSSITGIPSTCKIGSMDCRHEWIEHYIIGRFCRWCLSGLKPQLVPSASKHSPPAPTT